MTDHFRLLCLAIFLTVWGAACGDDGTSGSSPDCRLNSDCAVGEACQDGRCVPSDEACEGPNCPCEADEDCPVGFGCDGPSGICFRPQCSDDRDCRLGEVCGDGVCLVDTAADRDRDGVPDGSPEQPRDNCPNLENPEQEDLDRDGMGDACDPDDDGDGFADGDDNCPAVRNPDQSDTNADGVGNACDDTWRGVTVQGEIELIVVDDLPAPAIDGANLSLIGPSAGTGTVQASPDGAFEFAERVGAAGTYFVQVQFPTFTLSTTGFVVDLRDDVVDVGTLLVNIPNRSSGGEGGSSVVTFAGTAQRMGAAADEHGGISVRVERNPGGELFAIVQTDESGNFAFLAYEFESYNLSAEAPGFIPASEGPFSWDGATFVQAAGNNMFEPANLMLLPAADDGEITITAALDSRFSWLLSSSSLRVSISLVDSQGAVVGSRLASPGVAETFDNLPPGDYTAHIRRSGFGQQSPVFRLGPGSSTASADVELALEDLATAGLDLEADADLFFDCERVGALVSAGVNFSGANFSGALFVGDLQDGSNLPADAFSNGVFVDAEFREQTSGSCAAEVNLRNLDLRRADFSGAMLTDADFADSDLTSARLTGADAVGADFTRSILQNADFSEADLTAARFAAAGTSAGWDPGQEECTGGPSAGTLDGAVFSRTNLTNAQMPGVLLPLADLSSATLVGTNLSQSCLARATMNLSNLTNADLTRSVLIEAEMINSILRDTDLRGADMTDAKLDSAVMVGTSLGCFEAVVQQAADEPFDGAGCQGTQNDDRVSASAVDAGTIYDELSLCPDSAQGGDTVDWYALQAPAGATNLTVSIDHDAPFEGFVEDNAIVAPFSVVVELLDSGGGVIGEPVEEGIRDFAALFCPMHPGPGPCPLHVTFGTTAPVSAGQTYFVRVSSLCDDATENCQPVRYNLRIDTNNAIPTCTTPTVLTRASLSGANLVGATLDFATLDETSLIGALMSDDTRALGASFDNVRADSMTLSNVDLSWSSLRNADLPNVTISQARLAGVTSLDRANLLQANLIGINLLGTSMTNADLRTANLATAVLLSADLSGSQLDFANLTGAVLSISTFHDTSWEAANLFGAHLEVADFYEGVDCTGNGDCGVGEICVGATCTMTCTDVGSIDNCGAEYFCDQTEAGRICVPDNATCEGTDGVGVRLGFADMRATSLALTDLRRTDLSNAVLDAAQLSDTRLDQACLKETSIRLAQTSQSSFRYSVVRNADFSRTDLSSADFTGAYLGSANFDSADLFRVDFTGATVLTIRRDDDGMLEQPPQPDGARFDDVLLSESDFTRAVLEESTFSDALITSTTFAEARLRRAVFIDAEIGVVEGAMPAGFDNADLADADFTDAEVNGRLGSDPVSFVGATMTRALLERTKFDGADFSMANLVRTSMRDTQFVESDLTCTNLGAASFFDNPIIVNSILDDVGLAGVSWADETQFQGPAGTSFEVVCPDGLRRTIDYDDLDGPSATACFRAVGGNIAVNSEANTSDQQPMRLDEIPGAFSPPGPGCSASGAVATDWAVWAITNGDSCDIDVDFSAASAISGASYTIYDGGIEPRDCAGDGFDPATPLAACVTSANSPSGTTTIPAGSTVLIVMAGDWLGAGPSSGDVELSVDVTSGPCP